MYCIQIHILNYSKGQKIILINKGIKMKRIGLILLMVFLAFFQTGCEALEEALKSQSGCMLEDAPNYNASALLPCTSDCIGEATGSNCCCEEIIYGCMEQSAPNFSSTANSPCVEDISGVATSNACCTESILGCMDQGASNYNPLATVEDNSGCTYASTEVQDAEGNTITVVYGCMNIAACNYVATATADCKVENSTIAGSEWVQNDDCCDLNAFSACYLDLNNNGFFEKVDSTVSTCNCADLGVGWVSEDKVADDIELQGCTSVVNTGFTDLVPIGSPCSEYNPSANVDNGSCCLEEFSFDDFANFDESSLDFMGVFDVTWSSGMLNNNGDCVADTMMHMGGGPTTAQITLGPPDQNGIGQMQYFEEHEDNLSFRPEWELRVPQASSEAVCADMADENGSDWYYCDNWGHEIQICEDYTNQQDCPIDKCKWETKFCFPSFEGQPCETYMNEMDCYDNDCEWGIDPFNSASGHCFMPIDEPWMHCWELDEYACEMSPDCELESSDDFGEDFGEGDDCFDDCPIYPDDMSWTQDAVCSWYEDMLFTNCLSDCDPEISDLVDILKMEKHLICDDINGDCIGYFDDGEDGDYGEGQCNYQCEYAYDDYCEYGNPLPPDFSTCCQGWSIENCPSEEGENIFVDQGDLDYCMGYGGAGLTYGDCQGCSIAQIANVYSSFAANPPGGWEPNDYVPFPATAEAVVMNDGINYGHFCGWIDKAVSDNKFNSCDWNVQDLMFDLLDDCKTCDSNSAPGIQVAESDNTCHAGVFGSGSFAVDCSLYNDGPACNTITNHGQCVCDQDCEWHPDPPNADGTPSQSGTCTDFGIDEDFIGGPPCLGDCGSTWSWDTQSPEDNPQAFCEYIAPLYEGNCTDDCVGPEGMINCFGHICVGCLNIGDGMCNLVLGEESDTLSYVADKLIKATKPENFGLARANDCETGFLEDCSGDGDCCDESWLGDGYGDCEDQAFGCDLSCYDNDGGDCQAEFGEQSCVPSSECFDYDYENQCRQNDCAWVMDPYSGNNHCEPKPTFNPNACNGKPETSCVQDAACQWNAIAGHNDPDNFEPHCGPKTADDCFAFNSESECDASISCEWDAPDWMSVWQTGVCLSNSPCAKPENNSPEICDNDPMCIFDWDNYECVEIGSDNDYCDCIIAHTQRSCNDMNGSWEIPAWAEECIDCDWVEKECMLPMQQQDCFHGYEDPCAQFFSGGNEHTEWDATTHTCTKAFSFFEAGTWGMGSNCLDLTWNDNPEPECSDPPLQSENTCYCFDCEWNESTGSCTDFSTMGRTTDQAKMRNFQELIHELSGGNSDNDECMEYHIMNNGMIHLFLPEPDGTCQIVTMTPVPTSGS